MVLFEAEFWPWHATPKMWIACAPCLFEIPSGTRRISRWCSMGSLATDKSEKRSAWRWTDWGMLTRKLIPRRCRMKEKWSCLVKVTHSRNLFGRRDRFRVHTVTQKVPILCPCLNHRKTVDVKWFQDTNCLIHPFSWTFKTTGKKWKKMLMNPSCPGCCGASRCWLHRRASAGLL